MKLGKTGPKKSVFFGLVWSGPWSFFSPRTGPLNTSRLTSGQEETASNYGSESYAPSWNMFQNMDKEGLVAKEALAGEIMEHETTEVIKETLAH